MQRESFLSLPEISQRKAYANGLSGKIQLYPERYEVAFTNGESVGLVIAKIRYIPFGVSERKREYNQRGWSRSILASRYNEWLNGLDGEFIPWVGAAKVIDVVVPSDISGGHPTIDYM